MAARTPRSERFLIADAGNTTVHFGICTADAASFADSASPAGRQGRWPPRRRTRRGNRGARPARRGARLQRGPAPERDARADLPDAGVAAVFLTHETPSGIRLAYPRPWEIGADRIANAVAAQELHGAPAIVVDVGTALTFDCISARGSTSGGSSRPARVFPARRWPGTPASSRSWNRPRRPGSSAAAPCRRSGRAWCWARASSSADSSRSSAARWGPAGAHLHRRPVRPGRARVGAHGLVEPFLTLHGLRIIRARLPRGDGPG